MKGLILHYGSQLLTKEEVFKAPVPQQTASYMPLSHESFISRIEKQLAIESVKVEEQQFAAARDGQRLFGLMQLRLPGFTAEGYSCVMGLRNSYDKSFPTEICVGAQVLVCDNLSFCGDMSFSRKHTPNLMKDLSWFLTESMAQLPARFARQSRSFQAYQKREISDRQAHDIIIRIYDSGAVNITDVPRLLKFWRTLPTPDAAMHKTAWRLFNAATEALKGNIWMLPERTRKIHRILDVECEISDEDGQVPIKRREESAILV